MVGAHPLHDVGRGKRDRREMVSLSRCVETGGETSVDLFYLRVRWDLASLPTTFDTPMFWSEEDLLGLKGTAIIGISVLQRLFWCLRNVLATADKIGKAEAEEEYHEKVLPVVRVRHLPLCQNYS